MFLSSLINKPIFVGATKRGVCIGVAVSLKTYAVKYLLCSANPSQNTRNAYADFSVSVSAVRTVSENGILLSRIRAVHPKNCAKIFSALPVYSENGAFYGFIRDAEIEELVILRLITDQGISLPIHGVCAVGDAVILKKIPPYPIGQRIPAPVALDIFTKNEPLVTRTALRNAIEKGSLIRLTLSLPPFTLSDTKIS